MTPDARIAAAIEILDDMGRGKAAEPALSQWARGHRFAGSKDRAAIRDIVFDALRKRRSAAASGGGESGRALLQGWVRLDGQDPDAIFTGQGFAPAPVSESERAAWGDPSGRDMMDLPDWLADRFAASLGDEVEQVCAVQRDRAPVFLRVNALLSDMGKAQAALAAEGIETRACETAPNALEVLENARRVSGSAAYRDGLVEVQDAASQAVISALPLAHGLRVLDYCAGGGGKALAMAADLRGPVDVHDVDQRRMADIPDRAQRAGAQLIPVKAPKGPYDLILCDAPCSGAGTWRRAPEAKWALTPERLADLNRIQRQILDTCAPMVAAGGVLAYATCSVLDEENADQVTAFLADHPDFTLERQDRHLPGPDGDGLFVAVLRKA
ncbi:RsmB/NOP family class I SAM-dependent RNA methyltransferase [Pseudoprimorskyibacter insulae]|uniref:Ribosomal RNA small subunit methyltransferase B n=1 Tax=Pseudoprimorskyibacter insulae TaxID=1695997 RepID=A0A2R8AZ72_9RHOB|nr:RsmB/NOP family class I SAM-dependent RNA methyltransferase [Pseudoprimorskyibacter insulae]SPF81342.1 Ribosomal RNA small subunit methyltransferase B [Pseudoprimorskyibacter insulae]